jgi:hypothetical protein
MFFCVVGALAGEEAEAAARRAQNQVRRTASAPPSNAAETNARARRTTAATRTARGADAARVSKPRADESSARSIAALPAEGERNGGKAQRPLDAKEAKLVAKSAPDGKPAEGGKNAAPVDGTTARSAESKAVEARPLAKAPIDPPAPQKSTPEKFAGEGSAGDGADAVRPSTEIAAIARTAGSSLAGATGSVVAIGGGASSRPAVVTLEGPVFDSGDVPRAAASLERMKGAFARCASAENALTKNEASVDLRFLVRAPGRAEGVGADKARGLSVDVVRCMTAVLARSYIGAPSDDPVGVAVTVRVRKD